jgi:AcrR family transcriptional regulator
MRRRVEPIILQAAIKLFGQYGFNGVTNRALTREARVQEPAIYLWFDSKENLYTQAINAVVAHANAEFQKFVMSVFASGELTPARLVQAVGDWYTAIPETHARLLQQVLVSDQKRDKIAREPLDNIIGTIARALDQQKKASKDLDSQAAALALVRSLLWGKVNARKTADRDNEKILQFWLRAVSPA